MNGARLASIGPRTSITVAERDAELKATAVLALRDTAVEAVQHLGKQELTQVQQLLGHGSTYGIWETPSAWFPGGSTSLWNVDLRRRIEQLLPAAAETTFGPERLGRLLDDAVLSMNRYLVLCRLGPVGMGKGFGQSLDATSLASLASTYLPRMGALSVVKASRHGSTDQTPAIEICFSRITDADLKSHEVAAHVRAVAQKELRRMRLLADRGLWTDAPAWEVDLTKTTAVKGSAPIIQPESQTDPHLPLPDDYVSEMGKKSAWLITHLGPNIIRLLEELQPIWKQTAADGASPSALNRRCGKHLAKFRWTDADGVEISEPPFQIRLSAQGRRLNGGGPKVSTWPPTKLSHIFGLARVLQGAHLFVVGLSSAPRRGETITLKRSCVVYSKDGQSYVEGRTFKLVQQLDGETRDWVLPTFGAEAIEQQVRLVSLYERLSEGTALRDPADVPAGTHLWGQVGGAVSVRSNPIAASGVNTLLTSFAASLAMDLRPGGQLIRSHRFRKTLARLVALALTHAPKVLQDVLGHKSIEMTLYYILSDKDLAAEIETVARELRVMRAQSVVSEMVAAEEMRDALSKASGIAQDETPPSHLGGYGGPAAVRIGKAILEGRKEAHRRGEDWGAANVRELAEVLTMQGKTWQVVRSGVLCTKSAAQAGPCNRKKGKPEPARCDTGCDHRLEEAWLRQDVDDCISEAVELYTSETERGEDLVASLWAGQVRAHVTRFPDLEEKWMKNEIVRTIVESEVGQ